MVDCPASIGRRFKLITDPKILKGFMKDYFKDLPKVSEDFVEELHRLKGERLFVANELEIVCGYDPDYLAAEGVGDSGLTFAGKCKSHKESGLYVRFQKSGVCLYQEGRGVSGAWTYEKSRENDEILRTKRGIQYPEIQRALDLADKFNDSLDGYANVAKARE